MTNHTDRFLATTAARLAADITRLMTAGLSQEQAIATVRERTIAGPAVWAVVLGGDAMRQHTLLAFNPAGVLVAKYASADRRILRKYARRITRGRCADGMPNGNRPMWQFAFRSATSARIVVGRMAALAVTR